MVRNTAASVSVRFGEFVLDFTGRRLCRDGHRVRLTPKPFETLVFLVENRHQTVDKQQLLDAVWKDTAVTEGALVQAVREIRRALNDDDKDPRYILTIPRIGYRFIAEVASDDPPPPAPGSSPIVHHHAGVRWSAIVAGAGVLVAVVLILVVARVTTHRGSPNTGASLGGMAVRQLTSGPQAGLKPAYSPDGKYLLYVSSSPGFQENGLDLFIIPASGGEPRQLTKGINASGDLPVFTADSSRIAFSKYRSGEDGTGLPDLWTVATSGGPPSLLLAEASGAGFSPDGTEIAYTRYIAGRKALWAGRIDKLEVHREIAGRGFVPRWSPDGHWIAYTTSDPAGDSGYLWVVLAAGGEPVRLTSEPEDMFGLTWVPDSHAVFISSERDGQGVQLRRVPIVGGPATRITAGVGYYVAPSMSPNGRTIAFSHLRPFAPLVVSEPVTNPKERRLGTGDYMLGHMWPRLSPSGRRIASIGRPHEGERLWVTDADTGNRVYVGDRLAAHPDWLDDGRVAYLSAAEGLIERTVVYVLDVESGVSSKLVEINGKASWLAVHPNKQTLAFVARRSAKLEIVLHDLTTGLEKVIATGGQYAALRWRPDGSMLAWSGPSDGGNVASNGIWVLQSEGPTPRQIVKDGYSPAWSADGRAIYFARPRGEKGDFGLWLVDLTRGDTARIRDWRGLRHFDVVGDRLVIAANEGVAQVFEMRLTQ